MEILEVNCKTRQRFANTSTLTTLDCAHQAAQWQCVWCKDTVFHRKYSIQSRNTAWLVKPQILMENKMKKH